jgi:hypothetical protein
MQRRFSLVLDNTLTFGFGRGAHGLAIKTATEFFGDLQTYVNCEPYMQRMVDDTNRIARLMEDSIFFGSTEGDHLLEAATRADRVAGLVTRNPADHGNVRLQAYFHEKGIKPPIAVLSVLIQKNGLLACSPALTINHCLKVEWKFLSWSYNWNDVALMLSKHQGWRLPDLSDMSSAAEEKWPFNERGFYWVSTNGPTGTANACLMPNGNIKNLPKTDFCRIALVRKRAPATPKI